MGKHLFLQCISFLVSTLFFIFYAFKEDNTEKKANTVSSKSRKSKVEQGQKIKQVQKIKQSRKIKNTTNDAVDNVGSEVCKLDSVRGEQQQKKANLAVSRTKTNIDRIKMRASKHSKRRPACLKPGRLILLCYV